MLNRLAGAERSIVSDIPGTTRDAVDTLVERGGRSYRFVDTAGIRRKGKTNLVAEKLSVMMARRHLEQADVALLIVDASLGVTAERRQHRGLRGRVGPLGDRRHEQVGPGAGSRRGKSASRIEAQQ